MEEKLMENEIKNENPPEKKQFRDTLYGRINIPINKLDKFIIIMVVLLFASLIFGILV